MNGKILMILWSIVIFLFPGFQVCDASPLENDVELGRPKGEYHVHFGSDPVNLKNGNLYYPTTDLFIPCVGFPLSVTRSYNSRSRYTGIFGFGWSSNLDIRVEIEKYKVVMMEADGFRETFTFFQQKGGIRRFRSSAETKTVEIQNNKITMINRQTGEKRMFDGKGKILERADKYENTLTYQYNDEGHLTQIIDTAGRAIEILTDPTGKVIQIIDPIQRMIRYEYDAKDNLIGVTDRAGYKTRFSYDKLHNLLRIDYPNGGSTKLSYDLRRDLIIKELGPERRSTSYRYKLDPKHPESWTVEVIDALKNITRYDYSNNGYHLVITDALGGQVVKESCAKCGGRPESITDARGNTTRYEYTSQEGFNVTTETNALGHRKSTWYDQESWVLVKNVAPNGAVTKYFYDRAGNLIEKIDALGNSTKYNYDPRGLQTRVVNERGAVLGLRYDIFGNLISRTDPLGHEIKFEYDLLGRMIRATDSLGRSTALVYGLNDLTAMAEDPLRNKVYFEYNASELLVKTWDEKSTIGRFSYNNAGDLLEITNALNDKRRFEYDPLGRLVSFTNTRGFIWRSKYDALGREIEIVDPLALNETKQYDLAGNLVQHRKPGGNTSIYEFDALNRLVRTVNPLGLSTSYGYDRLGNIFDVIKENGKRFVYSYDLLGRLLKEIDLVGQENSYEYDSAGNQTARRSPLGVKTEYVYDLKNRLIKVIHPEKGKLLFKYDAYGNPIESIDMIGRKRSFTYDTRNQLISVNDYDGQERKFKRDKRGNIVEIVFWSDRKIKFSYDNLNRIIKKNGIIKWTENYEYDEESNLVSIIDNKGRQKTFSFDSLNRLTVILYPDGSESSFSYDASGNLAWWKNQHTEVSAEYGPMAILRSLKYSKPSINLKMRHNRQGNLESIDLPGGQSVGYAYDQLQRLKKISLTNGAWVTLTYDDLGRINRREYSNGLSQFIQYSPRGRISSMNIGKTQKQSICKTHYQFNNTGDLIEKSIGDQKFKYSFKNDRLVKADLGQFGTLKFTYDERGHRVQKEWRNDNDRYKYNQLGQLIRVGSEFFIWDDKGCLIERRKGSTFSNYKYNVAGLLNKASDSSGNSVSYTYDALDQQLSRKTGPENEYFVKIEGALLLTFDKKNTLKQIRVYEYLDRPLFAQTKMKILFFHQDLLENVFLITDEKGAIHEQHIYSPFGVALSDPLISYDPGYGSRPFEPLNGLYNMRFRHYAPDIGIFTAPDPIFNINPYVFAANNPMKFKDPFGLVPIYRMMSAAEVCPEEWLRLHRMTWARKTIVNVLNKAYKDIEHARKHIPILEAAIGTKWDWLYYSTYAFPATVIFNPQNIMQARGLIWRKNRIEETFGAATGAAISWFIPAGNKIMSYIIMGTGFSLGGTAGQHIVSSIREDHLETISQSEQLRLLDELEKKLKFRINKLKAIEQNKAYEIKRLRARLRGFGLPEDPDDFEFQHLEGVKKLLDCLKRVNCIPESGFY